MKKILFSIMALLAIAGTSRAQNAFSVADISLPQNGEATLTVSFQLDAEDTYTGYSFNLQLPSDLEFVMADVAEGDVACAKGACHDESHSVTANLSEGLVKVAGLSLSSKPLKGTSGVLLTFTIKPKAAVTVGQTFTGTIKDILLVPVEGAKQSLAESTFTVTISEPNTVVTLDETSTTVPSAATNVNVVVNRTINAHVWSTICLPFDMTDIQVKSVFGNDVKLGEFSGWSFEGTPDDVSAITIKFSDVTAITKHIPYIIKVSDPITSFTVKNVSITKKTTPKQARDFTDGEGDDYTGTMIGVYKTGTVAENNIFLSDNKFWYSTGVTKIKAFRAVFDFGDIVLNTVGGSDAPVFISFDGETTGINNVKQTVGDNKYYNLSGQQVENPGKGLYIQNGKKVIIK